MQSLGKFRIRKIAGSSKKDKDYLLNMIGGVILISGVSVLAVMYIFGLFNQIFNIFMIVFPPICLIPLFFISIMSFKIGISNLLYFKKLFLTCEEIICTPLSYAKIIKKINGDSKERFAINVGDEILNKVLVYLYTEKEAEKIMVAKNFRVMYKESKNEALFLSIRYCI